jgi:hypothetical protein
MAATYTKANIKKEKRFRLMYRILFFLTTLVIPCVIWGCNYQFMKTKTIVKISIIFIIVAYVLCRRFKEELKNWVNSWEYSNLKYILLGIGKNIWSIIIIVLCVILAMKLPNWFKLAKEEMDALLKTLQKFLLCLCLTSVCQVLGYVVILPIEKKYDFLIKRELRKQETRETNAEQLEDIREIIKEEMGK